MQAGGFSLHQIIEQVSKEKGIDAAVLTETMENAILTAAKKTFGLNRELEARYNEETGNVDLFQYMTVAVTASRRRSARSSASRSSTCPRTPTRRASRTRSSAIS